MVGRWVVWAALVAALGAAAPAAADDAGKGVEAPIARGAAPAPPVAIVIVEWRIKRGREAEFREYWAKDSVVADRTGLVGEFLSTEEEARQRFPWIRWETAGQPEYAVFYNVGIWRSEQDYADQVGHYIDTGRDPLPFEYDHRHRILVDPVEWRLGAAALPGRDSPGVK